MAVPSSAFVLLRKHAQSQSQSHSAVERPFRPRMQSELPICCCFDSEAAALTLGSSKCEYWVDLACGKSQIHQCRFRRAGVIMYGGIAGVPYCLLPE
jgi:hypothetical protein